ncbi:FtsX-like permease family protein [Catenulispora pinisilvae]|uniref:FtsX-like permease family protein n=1 Tax=Catenulispora pinisilvae TaxID=2705253 RepID=UPI0018914080|nr:FtsX-like permease family protein [Catenulispora pinisilvae]
MRIVTVLRRGVAARKARGSATAGAVAAAVAFLASSYILTDTVNAGIKQQADAATAGVSAVVTDARGFGGSVLTGAPTLPVSLVSKVRAVPGVVAAEGIVEGYAMPLDQHGHPTSGLGGLGLSIPADPRLRLVNLQSGSWPQGPDEAVVDAGTAQSLHLAAGSTLHVALAGGVRAFSVTGTVGFGGAQNIAGLSVVGFDQATAGTVLGSGDTVAAVEAVGAGGIDPTVLQARITEAVGGDYTVRTGAQQAAQLVTQVGSVTSTIGAVLQVFAVVSVVVAALLIANIFAVTVAQRTRELALLRCVGAGRLQLARLVLAEASLTGLVGALVGLPIGLAVTVGLRWGFDHFGLPLPAGPTVIAARTVVLCFVVGPGISIVAAASAARRASRSRPLAALSAVATGDQNSRLSWWRRVISVPAVLGGAALAAGAQGVAPAGLGSILILFGVGLAAPALVRPLTAGPRALVASVSGFCGRLAGRQMTREPRRVAGTAGTLAVAVATVSIVAAMAASLVSNSELDVRRSLHAELVASTTPGSGATLDPGAARRIAALPGVAHATGLSCGIFKAPGDSEKACGVDPATLSADVDPGVTAGRLADLAAPDTMAVNALAAQRDGWHLGQRIPITSPIGGTRPVRIVALYDNEQVLGAFLIPESDYLREYPPQDQGLDEILIRTEPGQTGPARQGVAAVLAGYPQAALDDRASFAVRAAQGFQLLATIMTALLALSLLIGILAVLTSLALSVLERTREIGLLRAVGAEASHIRTLIRGEALVTVATGTAAGVLLGLPIGWLLARAVLNGHLPGPPSIPVPLLAVVVPAAFVTGLLAAVAPARRAVRIGVLQALRAE